MSITNLVFPVFDAEQIIFTEFNGKGRKNERPSDARDMAQLKKK
jgi:hypothetical protein